MCMDKRLFPNTLYLPDRALLAVKSLIRIIDRESGLPYCLFDILSDPPVMSHTCFDWSDHTARTIDALILGQDKIFDGQAEGRIWGGWASLHAG